MNDFQHKCAKPMGKIVFALISALFLSTIAPLHGFTITSLNPRSGGLQVRAKNHSLNKTRRRSTTRTQFFHDQGSRITSATSLTGLACICIDCAFVTNCTAYHFVEEKHRQPHMTTEPTFTPRQGSPTIHVNIRPPAQATDLSSIRQQHQQETKAAMARGSAHGETVYSSEDLTPETTIEYDVVKCADFTLDKGCWVRNMPEEIKRANPDFVPT